MPRLLARSGLLLATLIVFSAAAAAGGLEKSTEYYAEAEHQHLVGELIRGCSGRPLHWGRKTAFTIESTAPCGANTRRTDTVAAHVLLHQDPLSVCTRRCDHKNHLPPFCGPYDPPEDCATPKSACYQACQDAYGGEEPGP